MPNQNRVSNAYSHYETVDTNLRLIESLSWLVICAGGTLDDDGVIADTMQIIVNLKKEAQKANDALRDVIKGVSHD